MGKSHLVHIRSNDFVSKNNVLNFNDMTYYIQFDKILNPRKKYDVSFCFRSVTFGSNTQAQDILQLNAYFGMFDCNIGGNSLVEAQMPSILGTLRPESNGNNMTIYNVGHHQNAPVRISYPATNFVRITLTFPTGADITNPTIYSTNSLTRYYLLLNFEEVD